MLAKCGSSGIVPRSRSDMRQCFKDFIVIRINLWQELKGIPLDTGLVQFVIVEILVVSFIEQLKTLDRFVFLEHKKQLI
jgi:hypothetical protein